MFDTIQGDHARNATLGDLVNLLTNQQARKVDLVTPANTMHFENGLLIVDGSVPVLDEDGVTRADGHYRPTAIFDEGLAAKFSIPAAYLRRLREDRPDLYDANANGWIRGSAHYPQIDPDRGDDRSFLIRTFKPADETAEGVARALLSDRYSIMDNFDVLTAALDGVQQAGVDVEVSGADLTDRRMIVRVAAPQVTALAPALLRGYRSPFSGASGSDNPTCFAGFVIGNSEVGSGAFTITPRITVQVCSNGMTITKDAMRGVHLGGKMDDGVIRWSEETMRKQLAVVTARAADAVRTFCDTRYMETVIARMEEAAGRPIKKADEVHEVTAALKFSEEHRDGILSHFIQGGQMSRGGIMHAMTAYAQTVEDGDMANLLEEKAVAALTV